MSIRLTQVRSALIVAFGLAIAVLFGTLGANAAAFTYVGKSGTVGQGQQDFATANCPSGQKVLGGGIASAGGYQQTAMNATFPADGPDSGLRGDDGWYGFVDNFSGGSLSIRAFAICSGGGFTNTLSYMGNSKTLQQGQTGSVTARCPVGKRVLGGGITNTGGYNQARVHATRPADGPDPGAAKNDAWFGSVQNTSGGPLNIRTKAICAGGGFTNSLSYIGKSKTVDPQQRGFATANCPSGKKVLGGGIAGAGSLDQSVSATRPQDGPDTGTRRDDAWIGFVDNISASNPLSIRAYAICHP